MKKRYKVPGIYVEYRGFVPMCDECGKPLVNFRGKWVCKTDMKLKISQTEEVTFGELYPNRESRRRR